MKLKPRIKKVDKPQKVEVSKKRKSNTNTLPKDEYLPMFEPIRFLVKERPSVKDPSKMVRQYFELSVKRFDDDEAEPNVWIQMYQESESYTGYLKGKTVYLPLEMLYDLIDGLSDLSEECHQRGISD